MTLQELSSYILQFEREVIIKGWESGKLRNLVYPSRLSPFVNLGRAKHIHCALGFVIPHQDLFAVDYFGFTKKTSGVIFNSEHNLDGYIIPLNRIQVSDICHVSNCWTTFKKFEKFKDTLKRAFYT